MRRPLAALFAAAALVLATTAGSIAWAYEVWKARSVEETTRLALPAYAANGLRHSLAAADTYAALRMVAIPAARAARLVERLGQLNEYKEYYGRPARRRDPTREIYKDLYNNAVGILAAALLDDHGHLEASDRLALLGQLTVRRVVLHTFADARVPELPDGNRPETSDLSTALLSFKRDRPVIYGAISETLTAAEAVMR